MSSPTAEEIARFRELQKLAYRAASAIESELREGMTERVVATMLRRWLADHGVHESFHTPFVWFGERTSLELPSQPAGFRVVDFGLLKFLPTSSRLEPGMPVILDIAPRLDGYSVEIGYGCCLGENPTWTQLQDDLKAHRDLILELVKRRKTAREIYLAVDALAASQGYVTRHRAYPGHVLAHRVFRMPQTKLRGVLVGGFEVPVLRELRGTVSVARAVRGFKGGRPAQQRWPFWNDAPESNVPVTPGLWSVEPHLGAGPVGSKWDEILVVTHDDAYWLDDDLPHVRRWAARGVA